MMQRSAGRTRAAHHCLLGVLAVLMVLVVVYLAAPLPDRVHQGLYDAIAATALVTAVVGLRRHRPVRARGWVLVLIGYGGWVVGDLTWTAEQVLIPNTYPAPSDLFYLTSYLVLGAGMLVFVRTRRGGRDISTLLDAAIITTGAGVLAGVFVIAPLEHATSLSLAAKLVTSTYPLGDLFLLGVLVRMYATSGARTNSYRLLSASLGLTLSADVGWNLLVIVSGDDVTSRWTDGAWLTSYILVAAATCVPSMTGLSEPSPGRPANTATPRRMTALGAGLTLPAVALLLDGLTGDDVHWAVIGVGTLLMCTMVIIRMASLLNTVQEQAVRLAALARSDSLTGAPNRRTWDHELSRACGFSRDHQSELSVAIMDLDRFKAYNDTHGHQAGDRLLREAVAAWTDALPAGALLARYGGEEFAVLFPGQSCAEAAEHLRRLRAVTPSGQTFSAGVAGWDRLSDPGTAIALADEALYAAKHAGRDRVLLHGQDITPATTRQLLPTFTVVTQPIVDILTMTVDSHEALTRFTGPSSPGGVEGVFRRAHAEGHGDLLELATIRAALALRSRPAGHDLYVNVSARAITSARFMAGLPNELCGVVVELNEDPDQVDPAVVAEAVAGLRARGARIALDDVGNGAQEFARLATLKPDIIKADRSLVDGCSGDAGRSAVLRALVTYAADLDLTVIAEGVEEAADLRHLVQLGVTHAQGYLLARPSPVWQREVSTGPARMVFSPG